ncbi:similar to phage endolysin [Rivularia sp. IAM M-261]|nr:similar to phage endolysin [Rivularia sp. IAM M-261]
MLLRIFISGLIGAASSVAFSYGAASVPCRSASGGADTVCQTREESQSLDSWKFGFVAGSLVGLLRGKNSRPVSCLQPSHVSVASVLCLGIYMLGSQTFGLGTKSYNNTSAVKSSYSQRMQAFLATIRWAETGTSNIESYRKLVFSGTFNDFSTHPLIKQCAPINRKRVCSTAAGAYQMLDKSWYDLQPKLNLTNFSPASQDKMAVEYIRRNQATADVEAGNFDAALQKVGRVWASIPYNNYNQNAKTLEQLRNYYQKQLLVYGGQ